MDIIFIVIATFIISAHLNNHYMEICRLKVAHYWPNTDGCPATAPRALCEWAQCNAC